MRYGKLAVLLFAFSLTLPARVSSREPALQEPDHSTIVYLVIGLGLVAAGCRSTFKKD